MISNWFGLAETSSFVFLVDEDENRESMDLRVFHCVDGSPFDNWIVTLYSIAIRPKNEPVVRTVEPHRALLQTADNSVTSFVYKTPSLKAFCEDSLKNFWAKMGQPVAGKWLTSTYRTILFSKNFLLGGLCFNAALSEQDHSESAYFDARTFL